MREAEAARGLGSGFGALAKRRAYRPGSATATAIVSL